MTGVYECTRYDLEILYWLTRSLEKVRQVTLIDHNKNQEHTIFSKSPDELN